MGLIVRPKVLSYRLSKGIANPQKLACDVEVHKLSRDWIPPESKAQDGRLVKGMDCILPTAQMKSASLHMELLNKVSAIACLME